MKSNVLTKIQHVPIKRSERTADIHRDAQDFQAHPMVEIIGDEFLPLLSQVDWCPGIAISGKIDKVPTFRKLEEQDLLCSAWSLTGSGKIFPACYSVDGTRFANVRAPGECDFCMTSLWPL